MQDFTQLTNYFENVLGIKSVLISDENSDVNKFKPLVFIQNFSKYSTTEIELTKKILAAVGLQMANVTIVEIKTSDCLFEFMDQPQGEKQIYSPRTLLLNPELKKSAWDKLKSLM